MEEVETPTSSCLDEFVFFAESPSPTPVPVEEESADCPSFLEVSRGRTARGIVVPHSIEQFCASPSESLSPLSTTTDPLNSSVTLTESKQGAVTEEDSDSGHVSDTGYHTDDDELGVRQLVQSYIGELTSLLGEGAFVKRALTRRKSQMMEKLKQKQGEAKQRVKLKGLKFQLDFKRRMRKVLTGDESRSLRRHLQESPQVKLIDKLCFTSSVLHMLVSEGIMFRRPHLFKYYYSAMLLFLMAFRYVTYRSRHWEYYMLDLCYFVNWMTLAHVFIFPQSQVLFEAIFVLSMGPLMSAIFVWRNSMVFHSTDKMTSLFIHVFPPAYVISTKWVLDASKVQTAMVDSLSFTHWILWPMTIYAFWQALYLLKTEVLDKEYLKAHTSVHTSLRFLCHSNTGVAKVVMDTCRQFGIYAKDEEIDADGFKAKAVFVVFNFCWALIMCVPTKLLFASKRLSYGLLGCGMAMSMFNGANYYVEVFAAAYNKILDKKHTKVTEKYKSIEENLDKVFERAWQNAYFGVGPEPDEEKYQSASSASLPF